MLYRRISRKDVEKRNAVIPKQKKSLKKVSLVIVLLLVLNVQYSEANDCIAEHH